MDLDTKRIRLSIAVVFSFSTFWIVNSCSFPRSEKKITSFDSFKLETGKNIITKRGEDSINLIFLKERVSNPLTKSLILIGYHMDTIPKDVFTVKNLIELHVSNSNFKDVPPLICNLQELTTLYFSFTNVRNFNFVTCLKKLTTLDLMGNDLNRLPLDLTILDRLNYLNLSNNDFSEGLRGDLPKNLKVIRIGNSKLSDFPIEVLKLDSVESIYLADNPISNIPSGLIKLSRLRKLILTNTRIPEEDVELLREQLPNCKIYYDGNVSRS